MQTVTTTIGGVEYTITELPMRRNIEWRAQLQAAFGDLSDLLAGVPDTDITSGDAVAGMVRTLSAGLIGSVDQVADMLFAYSPALAADRDRIEAEAFESELFDAFARVLGLAFPFGTWGGRAVALARQISANGSTATPTPTS